MQRMTGVGTLGVIITCLVLLGLSQAMAAATRQPGAHLYQMRGYLTTIDMAANSVVIEVQHGQDEFTIEGALSPTAVVTKGGKVVPLSALQVGDQVRVHWEQTATGLRIVQLEASQPAPSLQSPLERAPRARRSV